MDKMQHDEVLGRDKDYSHFWRIPEGQCELLSAKYSQQRFGRHSHDRYALGVITGGVEKLYYRGAHYLGCAGSVVTISPGEIHDGLPGSDAGWMYRMLYVDPLWLNSLVLPGRCAAEHIHLFQQPLSADKGLARSLLAAHRSIEQSSQPLERETLLLEVLAEVFQRGGLALTAQAVFERDAVRRIKARLEDELEQNISLEQLGQEVGMDPLYLIRVFKREVGVPPHSYQIQKRIAQVQRLLRAGMGVADASLACGFFDQSHMARAFKKVVGVTPATFRSGLARDKAFFGY
ncbi:AraC family transcriptional regulator [Pseudomonas sp.]|uniref:helix-turn-helix domain-containing protein n=1 Tax=Pseudomonas sp. TaxID=306 RepID=UPI0027369272|nr:AraC family transcriptional regulator [Pseudomonas sp.]MDP3815039.1 AraC family transcriptional regulator [Pseudomonas sp.]